MRPVIPMLFVALALSSFAEAPLRISEFAAAGKQGLTDEDGDTPDWIELQNTSRASVNLSGWVLQSRKHPAWQFPETNLAAQGFLVVFASGKDRRIPGEPLHTSFKLPAEGGELLLASSEEPPLTIQYPQQLPGVSFGISAPVPGHSSFPQTNYNYLAAPTPGRTNSAPASTGPYITEVAHLPSAPQSGQAIAVHAKIWGPTTGRTKVTLHYRVMFEPETPIDMHDAGADRDLAADDGIYTGIIPPAQWKPGQMIRYYVTAQDELGRTSRWPLFAARKRYSAYAGTVIGDATIESKLPVLEMIGNGKESALFFGGELYDNVEISAHGQISRGFPKRSFNVEFPVDHRFRYRTGDERVNQIVLLGNYGDKSKIRNTLAYEFIAAAGSVSHFAFPVRVQANGRFYCMAELVEHGDDLWLDRIGRDPKGALYKMYGNLTPHAQAEKKTRKREGDRDLSLFAAAIAEDRPLEQRAAYAYEHVDIPQCISYLVALTLIGSGDHGHKNFYLYRDTRRSGEWALFPWDVDLSWGRNWTGQYFDDRIYADNPLTLYRAGGGARGRNPLYNLFFEHPDFRQMYLRRLRTVMDELLQPPGTPPEKLIIEKRIREWMDQIDPQEFRTSDADLDTERWPSWGRERSAREEAGRILNEYLPRRRAFLFTSGRATLFGDAIPDSQPPQVALEIIKASSGSSGSEQSVCLANRNRFAVDVSGWRLAGPGMQHALPPGTVIPAGKVLYVAGDIRAFRHAERRVSGDNLFAIGDWKGSLGSSGTVRLADRAGRVVAEWGLRARENP